MKNGNYSDFLNLLYLGEELVFEFRKTKFFLQGWTQDDECIMELLDMSGPTSDNTPVWKVTCSSMKACADAFLRAPLWNGNTFDLIQAEIDWTDW